MERKREKTVERQMTNLWRFSDIDKRPKIPTRQPSNNGQKFDASYKDWHVMNIHTVDTAFLVYRYGTFVQNEMQPRPGLLHNYGLLYLFHVKLRQSLDLENEIHCRKRKLRSHFEKTPKLFGPIGRKLGPIGALLDAKKTTVTAERARYYPRISCIRCICCNCV